MVKGCHQRGADAPEKRILTGNAQKQAEEMKNVFVFSTSDSSPLNFKDNSFDVLSSPLNRCNSCKQMSLGGTVPLFSPSGSSLFSNSNKNRKMCNDLNQFCSSSKKGSGKMMTEDAVACRVAAGSAFVVVPFAGGAAERVGACDMLLVLSALLFLRLSHHA